MEVPENPLNGRGDTADEVLCSSSKMSFIIDSLPTIFQMLYAMVTQNPDVEFHKNPLNQRRDTADNILVCRSTRKVPYFIGRS